MSEKRRGGATEREVRELRLKIGSLEESLKKTNSTLDIVVAQRDDALNTLNDYRSHFFALVETISVVRRGANDSFDHCEKADASRRRERILKNGVA